MYRDCNGTLMKILLNLLLIAAYKISNTQATLQGSVEKGNYVFKSFSEEGYYGDAETFCSDNGGGWIAEPTNADLNAALTGILSTKRYWIGLRRDVNKVWKWEQDERVVGTKTGNTCSVEYCNWIGGDGDDDGETYAAIQDSGEWSDVSNTIPRQFVCQYVNYVFTCFTDEGLYENAETHCSNGGGRIAEPLNSVLNSALVGILETDKKYWIGLRCDSSKVWQWQQDGRVVGTKSGSTCSEDYCNWIGGDGDDPGETYAAIEQKSGRWIDIENNEKRRFACQYTCKCQNGGTCTPSGTYPHYACDCPDPLTGNQCETCIPGTCQNGGTCIPSPTAPHYTCHCPDPLTGNQCESCITGTCQNGGTCTPSGTDPHYTCHCPDPLTGNQCESCMTGTCQNGGICTPFETDPHYICHCPDPLTANQCESCITGTCQNGGTCTPSGTDPHYTCHCPDPLTGNQCESCISGTCQNGGTCTSSGTDPHYTCHCPNPLTGSNCETCIPGTCQNGGACIPSPTPPHYTCHCPDPLTGNLCESCIDGTCQNGGTCIRSETDPHYTCYCPDPLTGNNCETCIGGTCQNGGKCIPSASSPNHYNCTCENGYFGTNCESGGKPIIYNATSIPCIAEGKISVIWSPEQAFADKMHRIQAHPVYSGRNTETLVSPTEETTQTTIEGLASSTNYTIIITPCPTDCIDDLSAFTTTKTGVGLPGAVQDATVEQQQQNVECKVTWSFPVNVSYNDIVKFEVKSTETLTYQSPTDSLATITRYFYVINSNLQHISQPEPNRWYAFELKAETCAGYGDSIQAVGECESGYAAPYTVPAPNTVDDVPASTRQLEIAIPNENNGPITCIFVIVVSGSRSTPEAFDINDLRRVSGAATDDSHPGDAEYLALTIPKSGITEESILVTLGEQNATNCALDDTRGESSNNYYEARNWELNIGKFYSVYIATSTPVSQGLTDFQTSEVVLVDNGASKGDNSDLWIIGAVLGPLVIIAVVGAAFVYRKRKKQNSDEHSTDRTYETPYQVSDLRDRPSGYDNVTVTKDDDAEQHLYSAIPAPGYENIKLEHEE